MSGGGIPSKYVVDFLRSLDLPQINFIKMKNDSSLLTDYIEGRGAHDPSMDRWTIAIPYASVTTRSDVARIQMPLPHSSGNPMYCRQRLSGVRNNKTLKITQKNVVADLPWTDLVWGEDKQILEGKVDKLRAENPEETIRDTRAILNCRDEPLLLIHLFQFALRDGGESEFSSSAPAVSVSVGLTSTDYEPEEKEYAASVRMMEQLRSLSDESEDDDLVGYDD